jgi:hypothetical protein
MRLKATAAARLARGCIPAIESCAEKRYIYGVGPGAPGTRKRPLVPREIRKANILILKNINCVQKADSRRDFSVRFDCGAPPDLLDFGGNQNRLLAL